MVGPRAPIGRLSKHAELADALGQKANSRLSSMHKEREERQAKTAIPVESDSDSDSDSESSDSDSSTAAASGAHWKAKLKKSSDGTDSAAKSSKKGPSASDSSSSSDSDSSSDDSDGDAKKATKNKKELAKTVAVKSKDSASASEDESSDGSSSESESDSSDDEPESGAKVTNKVDSAASEESESDSDSGSESESEDEASGRPKTKAAATQKAQAKTKAKAVSKSTEMVINSDSDSDSESDGGSSAVEKRNRKTPARKLPEFIGKDFQLHKGGESVDADDITKLFRKAKDEGKQVWYFSVPSSLPIEVIQEQAIALDKMQAESPLFTHEGFDYAAASASADSADTVISVLIPSKQSGNYDTVNRTIDRSIHVKKVMRFVEGAEVESTVTLTSSLTRKAPRPQPEGLRARFQAVGAPTAPLLSVNNEDVEMSQAPLLLPGSETPRAENKKRKHGAVESETPTQDGTGSTSGKKSKKARVDATVVPSSAPRQSSPLAGSQKSAKRTPIAPPPVPSVNGKAGRPTSSPIRPKQQVPAPSSQKLPSTQPTMSSNPDGERASTKKVTPILPPAVPVVKKA